MKDFKTIIKLYVEKKISYESLNSCWLDMYINNHLSKDLPEKDQDVLEEIHEKIEYTVEDPKDDRRWGYIDYEDLRKYLVDKLECL